jgi:enamine deaminase RidA (YjgF/YER057c/UK114 family)
MKSRVLIEHEREFIELACEGTPAGTVEEETRNIFRRVDKELGEFGLSLENTVRTRLWARDKETRNRATDERSKILTGNARAASSSYIYPARLDSGARLALDVVALKPAGPDRERKPIEYEPPKKYLRYLIDDSFVFLSGFVSPGPSLENQLAEIFVEIDGSLADAGASWDRVTSAAYCLHRSQKLEQLKGILRTKKRMTIPRVELYVVDDFAPDATWVEVEVTARISQ